MKKEILIGIGMMCGTIVTCFAMYSAMLVKLMKPTNNLIKKSEKLFDLYLKETEDNFDK